MIISVSNKDREILKDLSKYIWWQDSDYAINHNTLRLIASAMCLANNVEDFIKVMSLDKELLKEALKQAQPGWFDARNWHFWHYRLYGSDTIIPKLKKRKCIDKEILPKEQQEIYDNLKQVTETDDGILKLADLNSLLITKLKATCDRSEYKDYIDIYTILKQGNEVERLSEAIIKFPNFFGRDFPSINLLKNLTYFEYGDLNRLTKKEKAFLVNTVEKVDANKIIEAQRRELQLKAIEQFETNRTPEIYNKFSLSKDENIFLAKRNLIDNIYKSARLEGIAVTFPQTEAVFNGVNVSTLKVDELVAINNLKHAWQFIFDTMKYPKVDFAFICEVNRIIGTGLYNNASILRFLGFIRSVPVDIGGTSWKPNLPMKADIIDDINKINNTENATEKAIDLMLYIMRQQMFLDGNKRTATLCANRILIENGAGLINIKVEDIEEFKTKLLKYYETNKKDEIKDFLFKNGINGIDIKKPSQEEIDEQEANTKMFQSYKTQKESNIEIKKIEQFKTNKER